MDNKEKETELLTNFASAGLNIMSEKERTELLIDYIQYVEDNRESEGSVTIWCPGNMIDISNELSAELDTFEVSISPKFGDIALVKNSEDQYSLTDDSVFYEAVELSEYIFSDEYKKGRVQHIIDNESWVEDNEIPSDMEGEDLYDWILEKHEEETGESFESSQAELIEKKANYIECDVESWISFKSLSDLQETLDKYQALEGNEKVEGMDFSDMDLSGMDLSGKDLSGCKFTKADMTGSILVNSNLSGADFEDANLTEANFEGAKLYGANMKGVSIVETNFKDVKGFKPQKPTKTKKRVSDNDCSFG